MTKHLNVPVHEKTKARVFKGWADFARDGEYLAGSPLDGYEEFDQLCLNEATESIAALKVCF